MAIYSSSFYGLPVVTGDIICTRDGEENSLFGQLWQLIGRLVPGEVDHCVLYLGPGGRCVESGPMGVVTFDMPEGVWQAASLAPERLMLDTFYAIAYPFARRGLPSDREAEVREQVAAFCLEQAAHSKPYNFNFFNPLEDGAFYCSQLIYKAYLSAGIDLNPTPLPPQDPLDLIVFPQDILNICERLIFNQINKEMNYG